MTGRLKSIAECEVPLSMESYVGQNRHQRRPYLQCKRRRKTPVLSIPERYMHTQAEVMHPDDAERTAKLIAAYILSGGAFDD